MRSLPLEGNSHLLGKSIVYFETSVDSGIERARSEFKKGDVAFLPSTGSFCFFVGNVESAKTMTPIGKFKDDNDELFLDESADLLFHYLILLEAKGFSLEDIEQRLAARKK